MIVARTFKTLSLSLPPDAFEQLAEIGSRSHRTGARVAVDIVLNELAGIPRPRNPERRLAWCCQAEVIPVHGTFVMPETEGGDRHWATVVVLLCKACGKQMHGVEYAGWLTDE